MSVPNLFPQRPTHRRIAIVGEAPGEMEERVGRPFVGASGRLLDAALRMAGISREMCFLGNVCQERPPDNDIFAFAWYGPEIQEGLARLRQDLQAFQPNVVVCLGNTALKAALDPLDAEAWGPGKVKHAISYWRGSIAKGVEGGPMAGLKCLFTLHPAAVLRDRPNAPFLFLDLAKAHRHSASPECPEPNWDIRIAETEDEAHALLESLLRFRGPVACDIEGTVGLVRCIGFSTEKDRAWVIPLFHADGAPWWPSGRVLEALRLFIESDVPKIWQYGLYDTFVLARTFGWSPRGYAEDTMLKHWELFSDLAKDDRQTGRRGLGLAVQVSLYTDKPYYKEEFHSEDERVFFTYCGKDAAVTYEISAGIDGIFERTTGRPYAPVHLHSMRQHYRFNMQLVPIFHELMLRGIRYDTVAAAGRRQLLNEARKRLLDRLADLLGFAVPDPVTVDVLVRERFCKKKTEPMAWREGVKKAMRPLLEEFLAAWESPEGTAGRKGTIAWCLGFIPNVDSPKAMAKFLYEDLGLPERRNEEGGVTTNYEALLLSLRESRDERTREILQILIDLRQIETRIQQLEMKAGEDGRVRCSYNIVGSTTGRVTCSTSPDGSGCNLQTIPNYTDPSEAPGGIPGDRDLFLPDPGYWFFQCDLSGADGWTVAAYAASLGDRTMLDDYLFGLKPAKILALILRGRANEHTPRETLKELAREVKSTDWDYFACKRIQHGCSYMEGPITISRNIFKDSSGRLMLNATECGRLRDIFFRRYPGIQRWHNWVASRVRSSRILVAASGQVRYFFGTVDEVLTKAVAFEPQANTTYATNLALLRLWNDPENRDSGGRHIVQPLHQVHDALCGQFPQTMTEWACRKIREWFHNPIRIVGIEVVIPFEGGYGSSWGALNEGSI